MEVKNKVELLLKGFDKCHLICDADCPLGSLYDYSCAFHSFILQRMKEEEDRKAKASEDAKPIAQE